MKYSFCRYALPIIFFLFFTHQEVLAACTKSPAADVTITLPASITVQRDAPVGTVLFTQYGGVPSPTGGVSGCSDSNYMLFKLNTALTASSIANVFNTSVPGVGVQIKDANNAYALPGMALAYSWGTAAPNTNYGMWDSWTVSYIVTGQVSAGTVSFASPLATAYITASSTQLINSVTMNNLKISGTTQIVPLACSITTPTMQFTLGDVFAGSLTSVGTTAKPTVFNLGLNCNAGARVNAQLTGTQNTDTSTAGVLKLTNAGGANVATGVGIQLLYNNVPLALGNNIVLKTSAGGVEALPFTAQYYQTKTVVTPGSANATATLQLTYQ